MMKVNPTKYPSKSPTKTPHYHHPKHLQNINISNIASFKITCTFPTSTLTKSPWKHPSKYPTKSSFKSPLYNPTHSPFFS